MHRTVTVNPMTAGLDEPAIRKLREIFFYISYTILISADTDFQVINRKINISNSPFPFFYEILNDDQNDEPPEMFNLVLSIDSGVPARIAMGLGTATITITQSRTPGMLLYFMR